ncbi:MAG: thioredoxin family protein [Planctomycetota bacterium]
MQLYRGVLAASATLLAAAIGGCGNGASGHVPHVDDMPTFEEKVLQSDRPVLVDFYKDNCPPCRRLAPHIARIHEDYEGRARVYKVHNRTARDAIRHFEVTAFPTVMLFHEGRAVKRWVGLRDEATYRDALDAALAGEYDRTPTTKGTDS